MKYKDVVEELAMWLVKWAVELDQREAYAEKMSFDPVKIEIERLAVKATISKLDELRLKAIQEEYNYPT